LFRYFKITGLWSTTHCKDRVCNWPMTQTHKAWSTYFNLLCPLLIFMLNLVVSFSRARQWWQQFIKITSKQTATTQEFWYTIWQEFYLNREKCNITVKRYTNLITSFLIAIRLCSDLTNKSSTLFTFHDEWLTKHCLCVLLKTDTWAHAHIAFHTTGWHEHMYTLPSIWMAHMNILPSLWLTHMNTWYTAFLMTHSHEHISFLRCDSHKQIAFLTTDLQKCKLHCFPTEWPLSPGEKVMSSVLESNSFTNIFESNQSVYPYV